MRGQSRSVAIVGGGIMGISVAYYLARRGVACDVFEASPVLGGLAGPLTLPDGTEVDRFYHAILSSDAHLLDLCRELGIDDRLRFKETPTAVFTNGGLHTMNSVSQLLRFQPLPVVDRFRLGGLIALAQLHRDWHALDQVGVEDWLVRLGGRSLFERLWKPMLIAKFDGEFEHVAATWMWGRLVRMRSTREGANQKERAGHLIGGYATLLSAMADRIRAAGGSIQLRCPVEKVDIEGERVIGVKAGGEWHRADTVVLTPQEPVAARLIPAAPATLRQALCRTRYLGIVCPLVVLDRPLTGTWTVNIADTSVPFTGVIETTSYIDPQYVGGHHLVYVPKYTAPDSRWQTMEDAEVREAWLGTLERMFPTFSRAHVRFMSIHRERYVDPLHPVGGLPVSSLRLPIDGLYLATTAQIYPALTNGESVTRHAAAAADQIGRDLGLVDGTSSARVMPISRAATATSAPPPSRLRVDERAIHLSIVVPCYNESANGPQVAASLIPVARALTVRGPVEVVFVNDGSSDETQSVFERLCAEHTTDKLTCRIVAHEKNRGLGATIRTGFAAARGQIIVTTDCDATYRFEEIPDILACLTDDVDMVTASQYHPNGRIDNVPFYRLVLSRGSSALYRLVVTRRLHTYTSLFRAYRREVIERVPFTSDGFLAGTEILVNAYLAGYRVAEYPTVLHVRVHGVSNAKLLRTIKAHVGFLTRVAVARVGLSSVTKAAGAILAAFALSAVAIALFIGLSDRPHPVQDEGAIMLVAKTWAQDGVMATRTSEGYETFGAIQSVGPTLLAPVALAFKLFGVGIEQGRAVAATMSLATAAAMLGLGWQLFGWRSGLLTLCFLVASPTVGFIGHGRQVLGEVPALGFLAAGAGVWARASASSADRDPGARAIWRSLLAGLLIGAAMVTKPQYVAVTFASLALCATLALVYYGRQHLKAITSIGVTAALCVAGWHLWQRASFGAELYAENAAKLRDLARLSYGLDPRVTIASATMLLGSSGGAAGASASQSDHLYFFAGPVALVYALARCRKDRPAAIVCCFLLAFAVIWLTAFLLFMPPVPRFVLGAVAICALFVAHLWDDIIATIAQRDRAVATAAAAIVALSLVYSLQRTVHAALPDTHDTLTPLASFLQHEISPDSVIETWDREVGVALSSRRYAFHYPDQSWLGPANAAAFRGAPRFAPLGEAYFTRHRVAYVVLGWYARFSHIYDEPWLAAYGSRVATIGTGDFRYEVIKFP
jgi:protoporphyrinogen oxidase/4-amino-4-deoxy-L-arabinose transferase-like glycosyltransferase